MGRPRFVVEDAHFTKEVAIPEHRENHLPPVLGDEDDLDLAIGDHVERVAGIIPEDDHRSLGVPPSRTRAAKAAKSDSARPLKSGTAAEDMDGRQVHGGVRSEVTGRYLRLDKQVKGPWADALLCDP
jgi:hypothetical protein